MKVTTTLMVQSDEFVLRKVPGFDALYVDAAWGKGASNRMRIEIWVKLLQLLKDVVGSIFLLESLTFGCFDVAVSHQAAKRD